MDKEELRTEILQVLVIITGVLVVLVLMMAFKIRSLEDRVNQQEIPEIKVKVEYVKPVHIEPSEDELKISINGAEVEEE